MQRRSPHEERLWIAGPAGRLEARLQSVPVGRPMRGGALLCHPHPLHGGTLANKVIYRIAKRLPAETDVLTLRFNFRGAGRSEGEHDGGAGEVEDAASALSELSDRAAGLPLFVVGFSFGAAVGLRAGLAHPRIRGLVSLGLPLHGGWDVDFLRETAIPRLFVQGEHDEFGDREAIESFVETLEDPKELVIIPGSGHLYRGVEDAAVDAVVGYIRRQLDAP